MIDRDILFVNTPGVDFGRRGFDVRKEDFRELPQKISKQALTYAFA